MNKCVCVFYFIFSISLFLVLPPINIFIPTIHQANIYIIDIEIMFWLPRIEFLVVVGK